MSARIPHEAKQQVTTLLHIHFLRKHTWFHTTDATQKLFGVFVANCQVPGSHALLYSIATNYM